MQPKTALFLDARIPNIRITNHLTDRIMEDSFWCIIIADLDTCLNKDIRLAFLTGQEL